jgi:hypothetical protein
MIDSVEKWRRRGPVALGELVGRVLDPVTARRGFATADLIAAWPEIVGPGYADCTRPDRIVWSHGKDAAENPGVLHVRVDGPRAVLVQHELGQIIERINRFLGFAAIGKIRLVQAPIISRRSETRSARPLDAEQQARLGAVVSDVDDARLRAALERLGHGVLAGR